MEKTVFASQCKEKVKVKQMEWNEMLVKRGLCVCVCVCVCVCYTERENRIKPLSF